jgi:hypothetical protein
MQWIHLSIFKVQYRSWKEHIDKIPKKILKHKLKEKKRALGGPTKQ